MTYHAFGRYDGHFVWTFLRRRANRPIAARPVASIAAPPGSGTLGGVTFADEDVLRYDPDTDAWTLVVDT